MPGERDVERPAGVTGWTRHNTRHALSMLRLGANPAAAVYDSIGPNFFLALDDGWLNLGLWEGDGEDPDEAPLAVRRLVRRLAAELPKRADVLDVGNGLGAQDVVIAEATEARSLTGLNITLSQLVAGRRNLAAVDANGVNGDACRMPFRSRSFDGVISVEAAFHFRSRADFFAEAFRVLRPGGVLAMSDVPTMRRPRGPAEAVAGLSQLRVWGLRLGASASAAEIAELVRVAGFTDVRAQLAGRRVIEPALRFVRRRIDRGDVRATRPVMLAARTMLREAELLWERGILEYLFLVARKPASRSPAGASSGSRAGSR
jgi:SAM-dependent methyltransferase